MKFTSNPTGASDFVLAQSLVLIDEYHREHLGMDYISDDCEIIGALPAAQKIGGRSITVVDSRPEAFTEAIQKVLDLGIAAEELELWCIYPKNRADLLGWIASQPGLADYSVRDYVISSQVIALKIGAVEDGDLDARGVLAGLEFGLRLSGQNIFGSVDRAEEIKLRQQLVSLVENLKYVEIARDRVEKATSHEHQQVQHTGYTTKGSKPVTTTTNLRGEGASNV